MEFVDWEQGRNLILIKEVVSQGWEHNTIWELRGLKRNRKSPTVAFCLGY